MLRSIQSKSSRVLKSALYACPLLGFSLVWSGPPGTNAGSSLTQPPISFDLSTVRPDTFKPPVGGIDMLSDGRLVVLTWRPNDDKNFAQDHFEPNNPGEVWLLSGVQGADRNQVKVTKIASGFFEPVGLKVVDDAIYVVDKRSLTKISDPDKNDSWKGKTVLTNKWGYDSIPDPNDGRYHQFGYGLGYSAGKFYVALGVATQNGPQVKNQAPNRGAMLAIDATTGSFEEFAGGFREPNGVGMGPDNEVWVADNQGDFLPSCKITNVRQGRFYGHHQDPVTTWDAKPETPPSIWVPYGEAGQSSSQPAYMPVGTYAGQLFFGDVYFGGLQRAFVEKVNGEWQGSMFLFAGGLEAGVNRVYIDKTGTMWLGEIGGGFLNWNWNDKHYGLQKLVPTGKVNFDMLAVRSRAKGMEIEFTAPVGDDAAQASKYSVKSAEMVPAIGYGAGNKVNQKTLTVKSAQLSPDKKRVYLEVEGLEAKRVLTMQLTGVTSATGEKLWVDKTWYTLNSISPTDPFATTASHSTDKAGPSRLSVERTGAAHLRVFAPAAEAWTLSLFNADGRSLAQLKGVGDTQLDLPNTASQGLRWMKISSAEGTRSILLAP